MDKEKKSEIHITNNFNAPIGQHIDHVDTINFRMDGEGNFHFGMVENTNDVPLSPDERIKRALDVMKEENVIKNSYDYAFVMQIMKETDELPNFDSPQSFLTYLKDLGMKELPSEDSLKKKISAKFGKHPSWTFTDSKGKDATEAKRRNNVASRFLSIYRKGKQ